jgi:uncharacterized protein (DUF433 family)
MEHGMDRNYVEFHNGVYRIAGTRVTLDSVVYAYWEGYSPETIAQAFWLDHEQIYGAIAFYLAHQEEVDQSVRQGEAIQESLRESLQERHPTLHRKLAAAKRTRRATR